MSRYFGEIVLIFVLVLLNGYLAAAEIALISARRSALVAAAGRGSSGARTALRLLEDPTRLLASVQVGITLVGFMASATAAVTLAEPVEEWMRGLGVSWLDRFAAGLSVVAVTLVIIYFSLVLGELVPKRLGLQRAESVAVRVAGSIALLALVVTPVTWVLARSTNVAARLVGIKGKGGRPGVTEEEIKLLVTEQGTLLDEEKRMIHEILELGDTVAKEIMVPRVDMVMLAADTPLGEALRTFQRSGFSRVPVYRGDPDTIIGVALLKDLVTPAATARLDEPVERFVRSPIFVPETKPILPLLSDMQASRNHMAVVVDEHGGTEGLVTIEDIVEEVIGDVADEFDRERMRIRELGGRDWVVDGRLSVDEARDVLGLPIPEADEYETMAGWVLAELGHIPSQGEVLEWGGYIVEVQALRRRSIARLRIRWNGSETSAEVDAEVGS